MTTGTKTAEIRSASRLGPRQRPLALHHAALKQCTVLADGGFTPAGRKAFRTYADRIASASTAP